MNKDEGAGLHRAQRTPGSVWVGVILAVVGVAQRLLPDAEYVVIAAVVLGFNFMAGLAELYAPMFSGAVASGPMGDVEATVRVSVREVWQEEPAPAGMTHETALMKLLIGG